MRRSPGFRVATLVFVAFTMAAPAFAAQSRDDSPIGGIERAIERVVNQVRKIFTPKPTDVPVLTNPT